MKPNLTFMCGELWVATRRVCILEHRISRDCDKKDGDFFPILTQTFPSFQIQNVVQKESTICNKHKSYK